MVASGSQPGVWLGGNSLQGPWVWEHNNASIVYQGWHPGEPSDSAPVEGCMEMKIGFQAWNDVACEVIQAYICEFDELW